MTRRPRSLALARILHSARSTTPDAPTGPPAGLASRRQVLRSGAAAATTAGLAAAAAPAASALEQVPGGSGPRVAVIGAGLAGLMAANQLWRYGLNDFVVYEAGSTVGGRCLSFTDAGSGLVFDVGGSFINSDHGEMLALLRQFGLRFFDVGQESSSLAQKFNTPVNGYYFGGALLDEAVVAQQLGPLSDQILTDADRLFADYDTVAAELDPLSVTDYLDRHIGLVPDPNGRSWVRELLANGIRSEYGAEPEDSSALQLLFLLPTVTGDDVAVAGASDERFVVEGGIGRLVTGLAAALGGRIEYGRTLQTVTQQDGSGYTLSFSSGPDVAAEYVILTVPASKLRDITFNADLPALARDYVSEISLGRNEKTFIGVTDEVWRNDSFVREVWSDLGFCVGWDATQRQWWVPGGAFTAYTGGAQPLPASDKDAGEAQLDRLAQIVPEVRNAATGFFARTDWTGSSRFGGAYANFRPGQLTRFGSLFWIEGPDGQSVAFDNLILAGEHTSDSWYGFMEGAVQTGRLAAELVLSRAGA